MDIVGVKVISGILFFLLVVVFGWIPFYSYLRLSVKRYRHSRYVMLRNVNSNSNNNNINNNNNNSIDTEKGGSSLAHCVHYFASGVLIATCLLHLLPESLEAVEKGLKSASSRSLQHGVKALFLHTVNESAPVVEKLRANQETREEDEEFYPIAELLVALGFISIYMFDSSIKSIQERNKNMRKRHHFSKEYSPSEKICDRHTVQERNDIPGILSTQSVTNSNKMLNLRDHQSPSPFTQTIQSTRLSENDEKHREERDVMLLEETSFQPEGGDEDEKHDSASATTDQSDATDVKSMGLVMALCIHGFFDGVMLGLQTSVSVIYSLLFALSLHKIFVAISMSLTLAKNYTAAITASSGRTSVSRYRYLLYVLSFASVAPLGIIASAGFVNRSFGTAQDEVDSMVPGCLQSFAVGTFLYVTFTETTGHHGKHGTICSELQGHLSLLMGFALMASLRLALGET